MPIRVRTLTAGGTGYQYPLQQGPFEREQITADLSTLTYSAGAGEVDIDGYIKPGTPLLAPNSAAPGALVSGASQYAGVVIEATYVGSDPIDADADLDSLTDIQVVIARGGILNRDAVEDNLGRALTANEIAALEAGGVRVTGT
jgi:hypothetical protein